MQYNKRMTEEEKQIEQAAVRWIRRTVNKRALIEQFASPDTYKPSESPTIIFTAGSPGAGKTEFIKGFREPMERLFGVQLAVIDPDAVRDLLPGYTGSNSYLFQRAVSIAVDDLSRHVLKQNLSAFVDGTLSDYQRAHQNIEQVIEHYGTVMVCYVFQHPAIAWHFTQLREVVEGRNIQKDDFINKFLGAKETTNKLKADFGDEE
jgi:UDP-N-acetylglucosamine kinase